MERKKTCILSHGSIQNDGRVLKTIEFLLSKDHLVWTIFPFEEPSFKFEKIKRPALSLIPLKKRNTITRKILRHSAYPLEFSYLATEALKLDQKFDYIYVNDLPSLFAGLRIKKKNPGSKLIYDSHEIFNETVNQFFPAEPGALKSFVYKILIKKMRCFGTWLENRMVKKVDLFITVNESLKDYFERKYRISNVKVMMNCPKKKEPFGEEEIIVDFRKKYGWGRETRVFLYQGVWNKGRGLELLIRTFKDTPDSFKLILIGYGGLEPDLRKLISQEKLDEKIKLVGFVAHDVLGNYTKAADVGLNLLEPFNLSKAMASPNKLFEYIHAGIPVICSDTPENRKVISNFDVGVLTTNTEKSLLNSMLYFKSLKEINDKKINLKAAANHYTWESQVKVLDKFLE